MAEGCTPLPKQTFNGHNVVVGTVRWGVGRLAVACTTVIKLTLSNGFGADAGGRLLWLDLSSRPPSYIYLGNRLAGCCYLSFLSPVGTSSTWLNPFISEVGPVNLLQNFGNFRAIWSQNRGVACLYLVPRT